MSNYTISEDFDPAITYVTTAVTTTFNYSNPYEIELTSTGDTLKEIGWIEFQFRSALPLSDLNYKYIEVYDEDGTTRLKQQLAISKDDGTGWSRCRINTFFCDEASMSIYIKFIAISDDEWHSISFKNFTTGDAALGKSIVTISTDGNLSLDPVSSSYVFDNDSSYDFTYEVDDGYEVSNVIIDGYYQETFSTTELSFDTIDENHTAYIEAFPTSYDTYTITITGDGNGTIYPTGFVNVLEGDDLFINPSPTSGYKVDYLVIDDVAFPTYVVDYEFENIIDNHTIAVYFASGDPVTYDVTASYGSGGSIYPDATSSYAWGKTVTYTIDTDSGYAISDVLVDGSSVGTVSTYEFASIGENHTIYAEFTFDQSEFNIVKIKGGTNANLVTHNAQIAHRELVYDSTNNVLRIGNNANASQDFSSTTIIGDGIWLEFASLGITNGVCPLDETSLVSATYLPSSITGAVVYKGTFDPSSGAPTPADTGFYYVASGEGTVVSTDFSTGDWLVYRDDTDWDKIGNSSSSVLWGNIASKPASFTPDTHSNDSHSEVYITTSGVTFEALQANSDVGSGATQVAQGSHNHDSRYLGFASTAPNSILLNGHDSSYFATAEHLHDTTYLGINATADDSTLWDGYALPATDDAFAEQVLRLNADKTAFEFATVESGSVSFVDLDDVPSDYSGYASYLIRVNNTEDGLEFVNPVEMGYNASATNVNIPLATYTGQVFEFIGTGVNWTLTRSGSNTIRMLSATGTSIASTSGYDCVCLIYIGGGTWLVKSSMGILEVT